MDEKQQLQSSGTGGVLPAKVREALTGWFPGLQGFTPRQQLFGALGLSAALLTVLVLLWYGTRPQWRTLYAGLDPEDTREMGAQLTAAGIPFDVSPDGSALRVKAENLDKARLAATAKGGPRSGRMGFELFDKPNWIGSEFDEKVNYQRALEGELEHTISSMAAIESARVHLTMAHDSLFTDQQRGAKASVVLKLKHRALGDGEADSIRYLVASAVDGLAAENVVLADADGRSILGKKTGSAEAEEHEEELARKLVETLEPVAGMGNVRASVNVEYDSSAMDETDENYDPNSVVTLSMQKNQQTSTPQASAAGVPGTASNAPNTQPPLFPSQSANLESITQESGTYGASKRVRHLQQGAGRVRRITAAVLINDRMVSGAKQVSWQSRNADEMRQLSQLAEAAIGYDQARGDQVSIENISFQENQGPPAPGPFERVLASATGWEPLLKYGTVLASVLALILFVVKPAFAVLRTGSTQAALPVPASGASSQESAGEESGSTELSFEKQKHQAQLLHENVVEEIKRDPALSSRLLQSWIHTETGEVGR